MVNKRHVERIVMVVLCGAYALLILALARYVGAAAARALSRFSSQPGIETAIGYPPGDMAFEHLIKWIDMPLVAPFVLCGFVAVAFAVSGAESVRVGPAGDLPFGDRACQWIANHSRLVHASAFAALIALNLICYKAYPVSMDEYMPVFQSAIFQAGQLTGKWPAALIKNVPFRNIFYSASEATGSVVSIYWPGYAILRTPFDAIGWGESLNPALAVAAVILILRLCQVWSLEVAGRPADKATLGLITLVLWSSSVFLVHGISFYPQVAVVASGALVMLLVATGGARNLFVAGIIGGFALGIQNPFPHLLMGIPLAMWSLVRDRRRSAWLLGGYALSGIPTLLIWPAVRLLVAKGSEVSIAQVISMIASGEWFFSYLNSGWAGSKDSYVNAAWLLKQELWSFPGATVLALAGLWRARRHALARVCAGQVLLTVGFYTMAVKFNQGHGWGVRYFLPAFPALSLGIFHVLSESSRLVRPIRGYVFAVCVLMLAVVVPWRLTLVEAFMATAKSGDPCQSMQAGELCVLRRDQGYSRDYFRNTPFLEDRKIRVLSPYPAADHVIAPIFPQSPQKYFENSNGSLWR